MVSMRIQQINWYRAQPTGSVRVLAEVLHGNLILAFFHKAVIPLIRYIYIVTQEAKSWSQKRENVTWKFAMHLKLFNLQLFHIIKFI